MLPAIPKRSTITRNGHLNARDRSAHSRNEALASRSSDLALLQMYTLMGMCEGRLEADAARISSMPTKSTRQKIMILAALQYAVSNRYNDDAMAQQIVDRSFSEFPTGPAHLEKAKYFDRSKDPEHAIAEAQLALQSAGNDLNGERAVHSLLGKCHFALGHTGEAKREQQWVEAHPNPETPRN